MPQAGSLHSPWVDRRPREAGTRHRNTAGERQMDLQRGPEVRSGVPYSLTNGPGVMSCPSGVLRLCEWRQADVVLGWEMDDLCSGRTYVTIGRLAVAVLSGQGVSRGGHDVPGTNYVGVLASGKLKGPVPAGNVVGAVSEVVCVARGTCIAVGASGRPAL